MVGGALVLGVQHAKVVLVIEIVSMVPPRRTDAIVRPAEPAQLDDLAGGG